MSVVGLKSSDHLLTLMQLAVVGDEVESDRDPGHIDVAAVGHHDLSQLVRGHRDHDGRPSRTPTGPGSSLRSARAMSSMGAIDPPRNIRRARSRGS